MIPDRTRLSTSNPQLDLLCTDDGSKSIYDLELDETYHSGCGACLESLHVYVINSGLLEHCQQRSSIPISILEYGFGLGWNFVLSTAIATSSGTPLRYVGLENRLLPWDVLASLEIAKGMESLKSGGMQAEWLVQAERVEKRWLEFRKELGDVESHSKVGCELGAGASLELFLENADDFSTDGLEGHFDIVYFDPFSPKTNPELWTERVLRNAWLALRQGGVLTSYCVKAEVRNTLSRIGFEVHRLPGPPGGKREVLHAVKSL